MRHSRPETLIDMRNAMLVVTRHSKQQCRQTAIDIQPQADQNERHPQRVVPHAFAATELEIAINRLRELSGKANLLLLNVGEALAQGLQGMFEVALSGDRMDNGYHGVIIPFAVDLAPWPPELSLIMPLDP